MTIKKLADEKYTTVEFQHWNRGKIELLGFCVEEPKEVLKKVFEGHLVHKYKHLHCPIYDWIAGDRNESAAWCGLVIGNTQLAPQGTKVVGSIDDLDLSVARINGVVSYLRGSSSNPPDYKSALKENLTHCFRGDISEMYDLAREAKIEYETAMLEVAEITLGITKMSFEELRLFLI